METRKKPGLLTGLLVGALVTAPVIALFFLADALVGLPLLPFDLTDWAARNLPGSVVTLVIDSMISVIRGFDLGRTDTIAKTAEHLIGTLTLFALGIVAGALLFELLKRVHRQQTYITGALFGMGFGIALALLSLSVNFSATTPQSVNMIFIALVFVLWGIAVTWVYLELTPVQPQVAAAPETASVEQLDRRQFLMRVGGATATLTLVGAGLSALLQPEEDFVRNEPLTTGDTTVKPTAEPVMVDGKLQPAPGTRAEYTPVNEHYLISISTRYPVVDAALWTLPITGLVNNPKTYTLDELKAFESMDQVITMACISNPVAGDLIGTTRWTGVSFQKILDEIQPTPEGKFMRISAADGFDEILDLEVARQDPNVMLCYAWNGEPLTAAHGFPLRIYIPNRYGMKQPRWITSMEVIPEWEAGYWVRRGWSKEALMLATSVIDNVAVNNVYEQDGTRYVPIGGISFAGPRGISKVEISIDDGEWVEAELREPLSDRSWVIWRYDWAFVDGSHTFRVRCVDGNGDPQIESNAPVHPDGATGIHRIAAYL